MPAVEEPYHYLQKKLGSILDELVTEMNENVSDFKNISKIAYDMEQKILNSRMVYTSLTQQIEEETKRQQEIETVLEYFDKEIDKLRETLPQAKTNTTTTSSYSAIGDIDSLINEFNQIVSQLDTNVPNAINILLNENMNLVNYIEDLMDKSMQLNNTQK
ncbi:hypothetical protein NEOKW01_1088 [Nematocida sp. AWRm80]|nr:hypothetical protein NEOKW01_1088 [Nematocida sp. AWRm80]